MQQRVPQFRLRSLTGLVLVSGFSLIVWVAIAYGVAQFQHASHAACAQHGQPASQACPANDR
jgi:hypothetical protein